MPQRIMAPRPHARDRRRFLLRRSLDRVRIQVLHQSTFTGDDDTNITAYTPDTSITADTWHVEAGTWLLVSNKVNQTAAVGNRRVYTDVGKADYTASVSVEDRGTTAVGGLTVRYQNNNNQWNVIWTDNTYLKIYERTGGVLTERAGIDTGIGTGTHTIKATCQGATITAWLDDAHEISYNEATAGQTATKVGIHSDGNVNARFDDFLVIG